MVHIKNLTNKTNAEILEYKAMVNHMYDYYDNLARGTNDRSYSEDSMHMAYIRECMKYATLKEEITKEIKRRIDEEIVA